MIELNHEYRRAFLGNEPLIFHCHHYNCFLQRTLQDAAYIDTVPIMLGAAAEASYNQLRNIFSQQKITDQTQRKKTASEIYRLSGYGLLPLEQLNADGGQSETLHSHFAMGWVKKFGPASEPVCHFATGWLAGAAAAIFDLPNGSFNVRHDACRAMEKESCIFKAERTDWVHGIIACINAFGWGRWQVLELSDGRAQFAIQNDYESSGYLAMYGRSNRHISYLTEGGATGVMNLIFLGDITAKPDLTPEYYDSLFKTGSFKNKIPFSTAKGDRFTAIHVFE